MRKAIYILVCLILFGLGTYVWRIKNTGLSNVVEMTQVSRPANFQSSTVVEIGDEQVTQEDVDWEYDLVTSAAADRQSLTAIPDLGSRYDVEMQSLRKELISAIVERKLLFRFVQQDRDFQFDDPARYTTCLTEWQDTLKDQSNAVLMKGGRERLKSRLCERSILDQYMKERLFASLKVEENDVLEFYKNHMAEFKRPEMVVIRHILLGDEQDAKRARNQVNAGNFAEIAKTRSLAPEAVKGGLLPAYALGSLPIVFDDAFKMKKGDISDVLKSNYGYHLIMLLEKYPKKDLGLEDARPKIVKTLRKRLEEVAYKQWVERAQARITVAAPKTATW